MGISGGSFANHLGGINVFCVGDPLGGLLNLLSPNALMREVKCIASRSSFRNQISKFRTRKRIQPQLDEIGKVLKLNGRFDSKKAIQDHYSQVKKRLNAA